MLGRTRILLAAVCAVASLTVSAYADDAAKMTDTAAAPAPAAEEPARRPLMSLLDAAGVGKPLDDIGVNIYGHAEGSYTYNALVPTDGMNTGRVFDVDNEEVLLNQLDMTFQRTVDPTKNSPDIGFTVEVIYGSDSRYIHSNGLNFYGSNAPQLDPENQFDLTQAYVDIVPFQNVLVRGGKFVTHMGYETINPTTNQFYSHSFSFGYAIPFTQTGGQVYWNATDQLTLMFGVTRGWDQALVDNNDSPDYNGQIKYAFSDKLVAYFNFTVGPQVPDNDVDYSSVVEGIVSYAITDQFTVAGDGVFGWLPDGTAGGDTAFWYGIAAYASYKINDPLTFNLRGEWFNDDDDARGLGTTVYEGTAGVTITPFPSDKVLSNLKFRPEIRWDYGDDPIFDGENSQFTAAIDAIFMY